MGELEDERQRLYAREEQLRQNLAALHTAGPEASLRQQVFTQLQASEARLAAIDKRAAALQEQNQQQQQAIEAALETLAVDEVPAPSS